MAVNLHSKYRDQIEQQWTLNSLIAGKLSSKYDFTGNRSIKLSSITTQALATYSRSTGFGSAVEVADWLQEFTLSQEKSFNMKIDALNASDQNGIKAAGPILAAQLREQVVPYFDKWALKQAALYGGKSVVLGAATSKSNIVGYITDARKHFTDALIPEGDRYLFLSSADYAFVLQSPEFIAVDTGEGDIAMKGVVGKIAGFWVVETPTSYLPTSVRFIAIHKDAFVVAKKVEQTRIIDSESFIGKLLQGLFYGDAFVVGVKADGVYTAIANGASIKCATPTATQGGVGHTDDYTLASTAGSTIYYTSDGTDPRFSTTATAVATGTVITLAAGGTGWKFAAKKADLITSDILTQDMPIV